MKAAPLRVFVHIPKTAGTSVNAHLAAHGGVGRKHIEKLNARPARLARLVQRADWVSGHIPGKEMQARVAAATTRDLRIFALVRDPVAQIASHYNWMFVIYHRGPWSWWRQTAPFRALSRRIREADSTDPAQVIDLLRANAPLFLNMQADYLLGTREALGKDEIAARLSRFEHVGMQSNLPGLFEAMGLPAQKEEPAKNVSPYYFDKSIFERGPVRDFLEEAHAGDLALYRAVSAMHSGSAVSA